MNKHALANELREICRRYDLNPDGLSDELVIQAIISCPGCQKQHFDKPTLKMLIDAAKSGEHFMRLRDQCQRIH